VPCRLFQTIHPAFDRYLALILANCQHSQLISTPLNRLQSAANSLGNGDPLPDTSTGLTEVDVVHAAMRKAGQRQQLLLDKLNHRVKNTLATVQSIAYLSLKTAKTLHDFGISFETRLISLANTHNLLRQNRWQGSSIRSVLQNTLAVRSKAGALHRSSLVLRKVTCRRRSGRRVGKSLVRSESLSVTSARRNVNVAPAPVRTARMYHSPNLIGLTALGRGSSYFKVARKCRPRLSTSVSLANSSASASTASSMPRCRLMR
jgi:hypothetical protein